MVDKFQARYVCRWCGYRFDRVVGKGYGQGGGYGTKTPVVSDTVTCPNCTNHLKTWNDAIELMELK